MMGGGTLYRPIWKGDGMTQSGSSGAPYEGGDAHAAALAGLVARGVINSQQADAVREALANAERGRTGTRWAEIVGYVGGGLVFAGVVALVGLSWGELPRPGRIVTLVAISAALLAGGLVAAGGPRELRGRAHRVRQGRRRLTGLLWSLTAVAVMLAVGEAANNHGETLPLVVGLAIAVAAYAALPSAVGLVVCGLLSLTTLLVAADMPRTGHEITTALLLIGLAAVWCGLAAPGLLTHRRLGYGIAAAIALIGAQFPTTWSGESAWAYALTFVVAAAFLALYQWDRQVVLLVAGVLGLTIAAPQAIWDWTDGAIGGAMALLIAGLVLLLTSGIGLKLHRAGPEGGKSDTEHGVPDDQSGQPGAANGGTASERPPDTER